MEDVRKQLIRGLVEITRHKEFYGHVVQQFEKVHVGPSHPIKTAAVGRMPGERFIKLYLNDDYFRGLLGAEGPKDGWEYILGALEHEIVHVVLDHIFLSFPDKVRAGVAMDLVVNQLLPSHRVHRTWVTPEMFGLPMDKSVPWYYRELGKNDKFKKMSSDGSFGGGSHGLWDNVSDDPMAREFIKDVIRKSKEMSSGFGNIPGQVVASIEDLLRPKPAIIPWGRVLRMFCASATESVLDYTMKRLSRRFGTRPGTVKGDVLNLAVCIDTSASISDEKLAIFFNEVRWIHRNGAAVTIFEADTRVVATYAFKGRFDGKVHGRGGTDLEPAMAAVEGKFDAVVYFTDFEAPRLSREYRVPTLWVLTKEMPRDSWPCQWGRVIVLEEAGEVAA